MSTLPKQQPSTPPIKQLSVDTTPSSHKSDKGKKLSNYEYAYGNNVIITDVWHENLQQEMERIIHLVEQYPFVAMVRWRKSSCTHSFFCRIPNSLV